MAGKNYEIKTSLSLDGEKEFKAALGDANRSMRVMDSELKKLQAAYEAGGSEMDYYTGRSRALEKEFKQQQAIVDTLERTVREAADAYGEASAKTQGYQIQLNNAEAKLSKLARASEEANRELEELGRDSNRIGRQIENGIGDAAEDTARKVDDMFENLSEDIAAIRSNTSFEVFSNISSSILGAAGSLDSFAESSRDYRRSMSFLEYNAGLYGLEFENIKELFFDMASVSGDADASVEALSNLMATGFDSSEMVTAVDALTGAVVRFPDTLKFESLADGLQETLATGKATGQYAELLERLGVNLDDFNEALGEAETAEEKQSIALAYLVDNGLVTTGKGYRNLHSEITNATESTLKFNDTLAELAGEAEPYITAITNFATARLKDITYFVSGAKRVLETGDFKEYFVGAGETEVPPESQIDQEKLKEYNEEVAKAIYEKYGITEEEVNAFKKKAEETRTAWENEQNKPSIFDRPWYEFLIPSAGASELETAYEDEGSMAWTFYANGLKDAAAEENAFGEAVREAMETTEAELETATTAGTNVMTSFANGIAAGKATVMENVNTLVNQINQALASIAMPAFGFGLNGITGGNVYVGYGADDVTSRVSRGLNQRIQEKLYIK